MNPEWKQMLELADKDIKTFIITVCQMFKKLEERLNKYKHDINKKAQIILLEIITKISEIKKSTDRIVGRLDIEEEMIIKLDDSNRNYAKLKTGKKSSILLKKQESSSLSCEITSMAYHVNLNSQKKGQKG